MEDALPEVLSCTQCETIIKETQKYCTNCGYPQRGSAGDKSKFHAERIMNRSKAVDAPKTIRQARNILFIVAGITFIYGIFLFFYRDDMASLIAAAIMTGVYVVLGYWSQQKPLISLVLALLLYATNMVLSFIIEPDTLYKGLIFKVIIIYFLIRGINSAMHLRKAK